MPFDSPIGVLKLATNLERVLSLASRSGDLKQIVVGVLMSKEFTYKGQRRIVCYNEGRAALDKDHRESEIKCLKEKIRGKTVKSLIGNPHYIKFLKINEDKTKVSIDEARVKVAPRRL